jgi:hypothetical protein
MRYDSYYDPPDAEDEFAEFEQDPDVARELARERAEEGLDLPDAAAEVRALESIWEVPRGILMQGADAIAAWEAAQK